MKSVDKKVASYLRVMDTIALLFYIAVTVVVTSLTYTLNWYSWIPYVFIGITLLHVIVFIIIKPSVYVRVTKYDYDANRIIIRKGFFYVKTEMVPVERIQEVVHTSGPVSRKFNLATLSIHTASSRIEMPPIDHADLLGVQHKLLEYVKEDRIHG